MRHTCLFLSLFLSFSPFSPFFSFFSLCSKEMEEQRRQTSSVAACGLVTVRIGADGRLAGEPLVSMRAIGYRLRDDVPELTKKVAARVVELVKEAADGRGDVSMDLDVFREFVTAGIDDLTTAETGGRVPTLVHIEAAPARRPAATAAAE
jgi:hypothetical protein